MAIPSISDYLTNVYAYLTSFAVTETFWVNFESIYGTQYDFATAEAIRSRWASGNFSALPIIEVVSAEVLGSASGGYAASKNRIYLSNLFLASASSEQIVAVMLEEIGHYVDAQVNTVDMVGDEGEYFSAVVLGKTLNSQDLLHIQEEDDVADISLMGEQILVEQADGNQAPSLLVTDEMELAWDKFILGGTIEGTSNRYYNASHGIAIDNDGNIYTTGYFQGTADFDPGDNIFNLTANSGGQNDYISKLDSNGDFVWVKSLGTNGGSGIAVDGDGSVYTTGSFRETVDFDPGDGVFNLSSKDDPTNTAIYSDAYISKLNSDGSFVWANSLGEFYAESGSGIAVDSAGNVYTTGSSNISNGSSDAYISKLNNDGTSAWTKYLGGTSSDGGNGIAVDSAGNVYSIGYFRGTVNFGGTTLTSQGAADVYISKLDNDGNFTWTKSLGGSGNDYGNGIAIDDAGNVYITGYFSGTVDFDPGEGVFNLTANSGGQDAYISKLDSDGNVVWAKSFGDSGSDEGSGIAVDGAGNVYATGDSYDGNSYQSHIWKLDNDGTLAWTKSYGDENYSRQSNGITVGGDGNVYTTGSYEENVEPDPFDPFPGPPPSIDTFILKLAPSSAFLASTTTTLTEDTDTTGAIKVADIVFTDDALGEETITLTGDDAGLFKVVGTELFLKANTVLDFETNPELNVMVNVDDPTVGDTPDISGTLTIAVTDVDEFDVTTPTDSDTAENTVTENATFGTAVGITANATDEDGSNNAVTYSLTDDAGGLFTIDSTTGIVTVAGALDYETTPSHDITVQATSSDGSTSTQIFTIAVTDVNEFDVTISTDSDTAANTIAENASAGAIVGITVKATDEDGSKPRPTWNLEFVLNLKQD